MPAFEKSSVGSFAGTSDEDRTTRWPRARKNSRKRLRISFEVISTRSRHRGTEAQRKRKIDLLIVDFAVPLCLCGESLFVLVQCFGVHFFGPRLELRPGAHRLHNIIGAEPLAHQALAEGVDSGGGEGPAEGLDLFGQRALEQPVLVDFLKRLAEGGLDVL